MEDGKKKIRRMHANAMAKLRELRFGDLVEITAIDHCTLDGILTCDEAWREVYDVSENGLLTSSGYYVGYDSNFVVLSTDKIRNRDTDRGNMNVILTKYVIKVEKVRGGGSVEGS